MTDQIIRIRSSRQGYRRGGLDLGRDWREVDTTDLSEAQKRAILQDPVLTIEGREDDGSWSPLPAAVRAGLASLFKGPSEADAAGVQPEIGTVVDDAELEQLKAEAEVGRVFRASVTANAEQLFALGFSPDRTEPSLLIASLLAVVVQRGDDARRIADQAELGIDLSSAIADSEELLTGLDLWPVKEPARFFLEVVDQLVAAQGEIERLKNNPAESQEGGGAGDGAGPAGGEDSREEGPETAGNTSSAGATPPAEPAPKPKPAATPKPAAKGKGGASKSS